MSSEDTPKHTLVVNVSTPDTDVGFRLNGHVIVSRPLVNSRESTPAAIQEGIDQLHVKIAEMLRSSVNDVTISWFGTRYAKSADIPDSELTIYKIYPRP